jgi:hypothetical protein
MAHYGVLMAAVKVVDFASIRRRAFRKITRVAFVAPSMIVRTEGATP